MRLVIDGIHVDSKVVPVGVAADGQLALPADVRTVGWYALGPGTGAAGTALFAAHVDEGAEEGLFFSLRSLPVGSAISVTTADGRVHDYRVLARRIVAKQHLQPQLLESVAGPPRLLLVTCGGAFNHATRSYASNVLVWAAAAA